MKIVLNNRNLTDINEISTYINRKVELCFSRNRSKIKSITIILADINGPKGGKDKQCKILVNANHLPEIVVVEKREGLLHAIDSCLMRANRVMEQQLKRRQGNLQSNRKKHLIHQYSSEPAEQISA